MTKITVTDQSHEYSMLLRFTVSSNMIIEKYWFDIVDDTEMNF